MVTTSSAVREHCKFSCSDGACVSAELVCDGATHCANGDDELSCERALIILSSDDPAPRRSRIILSSDDPAPRRSRIILSSDDPAPRRSRIILSSDDPAPRRSRIILSSDDPAPRRSRIILSSDDPAPRRSRIILSSDDPAPRRSRIILSSDDPAPRRSRIILSSDDPAPRRSRRHTSTLSRLQNGTCTLPEYPAHGTYSTNMPNSKPGEAYEQVNISMTCRGGFVADSSATVTCIHGHWQNKLPKCVPCGTLPSSGIPLIAGGVSAKRAEVPWHAGIYMTDKKPYRQICGGSLISADIVLSAAHCFWNNTVLFEGAKLPAAKFAVAAGKLYRPWNEKMDTAAQKSDVKEINLPPHFQGSEAHFQHDIAVLILAKPFVYNTYIWPVCVDFDTRFDDKQLQPGNKGMVAGWGHTAENAPVSQVLKVIELPYISVNVCIAEAPLQFIGHITDDKICAGFKDEGKAVCEGDSGGGLAFPESVGGTTRFYLRGIVSTAPEMVDKESFCNINEYATFTHIQNHEIFIKNYSVGIWSDADGDKMQQREGCTLPPYPDHGTYVVTNAPDARPGDTVDFAVINATCGGGYAVSGSSFGYCSKGKWQGKLPKCVVPCKEESLSPSRYRYTPDYSMDDASLDHYGTWERNSTGHRTYFELHFAAQTDGVVAVYMSENEIYLNSSMRYIVGVGEDNNLRTKVYYNSGLVQKIDTPDINSATQFRSFYIKMRDDKLQFGTEGDTPLISYSDTGLRSMKYYRFEIYYSQSAKLRYCPAAIEGLPCKDASLISSNLGYTPLYSMDDVSIDHYVTLKRNSTGHRTYFELHFAVLQTDGHAAVSLSEKDDYIRSNSKCQLRIGMDSNQRTRLLCNDEKVQEFHTPDIFSTIQFRAFYIKIDDGELQFGKEGDTPIISYSDASLRSMNYYGFELYYNDSAKLRYCPAAIEGST